LKLYYIWSLRAKSFSERLDIPEYIAIKYQDATTILTYSRPAQRNVLSEALCQELIAALTAFNIDKNQHALVITGSGDRAFCAGQALKETKTLNAEKAAQWQEQLRVYMASIRELDKPCIAANNGAATGAGFYTALLCDIRIAHTELKVGQLEINVGFPSILSTRLMYMTLGH